MTRPVTRYLGGVFTSFYGVGVRLWVGELSAQLFGAQLFGTQLGEIIERENSNQINYILLIRYNFQFYFFAFFLFYFLYCDLFLIYK